MKKEKKYIEGIDDLALRMNFIMFFQRVSVMRRSADIRTKVLAFILLMWIMDGMEMV